jgi:hypothetical protein
MRAQFLAGLLLPFLSLGAVDNTEGCLEILRSPRLTGGLAAWIGPGDGLYVTSSAGSDLVIFNK